MAEEPKVSQAIEAVQGPAGNVEALAAAISARLRDPADGTPTAVQAVWVSEETLARDFAAQGEAAFEGPNGPVAGRGPDPQAVKAWLARVCRALRLSCTYEAKRGGYVFRRARPITPRRV